MSVALYCIRCNAILCIVHNKHISFAFLSYQSYDITYEILFHLKPSSYTSVLVQLHTDELLELIVLLHCSKALFAFERWANIILSIIFVFDRNLCVGQTDVDNSLLLNSVHLSYRFLVTHIFSAVILPSRLCYSLNLQEQTRIL